MRSRETVYEGRCPGGGALRLNVSGGAIVSVESRPDDERLPWLLPVLVDLQHNGALGHFFTFMEEPDLEIMPAIMNHIRRHGVGRVRLTLITVEPARLEKTLRLLDRFLSADPDAAALFFEFFQEGLFISPADGWRGAHLPGAVINPDYDLFLKLDEASGGRIKAVNVAPEQPGGLDFISRAVADGRTVCLGHACPDTPAIREAAARGASVVTHFGNGSAPMIHRFKNPFWGFLDTPGLRLGLICDGCHLPPEVVGTAYRCKGADGCLPVSDSGGDAGKPPGIYRDGEGRAFEITSERRIVLAGSELMIGAWFQQDRCVEFLVEQLKLDLVEAWRRCSEVPAAAAGIRLPRPEAGEEASFVLARWQDGLVIEQAVHRGVPALKGPSRPSDPGQA